VIAAVTAWVKNIILVVLFASFMELLLPNTSMKKFIRVIMGIFIMLAILNPLLLFFQTDKPDAHIAVLSGKETVNNAKANTINEIAKTTVTQREELLASAYKEDLARQISAVVKSIAGVEDAHTKLSVGKNGKISKATIYIKPATANKNIKVENITLNKIDEPKIKEGLTDKVKQTISQLYQVPEATIELELLS
jgi:stage III sporulation protein AF